MVEFVQVASKEAMACDKEYSMLEEERKQILGLVLQGVRT